MENKLSAKVTQYTHTRNGRPLKINKYEFVGRAERREKQGKGQREKL